MCSRSPRNPLCAESLSHVWLFVTPWTITHQVPLSMRIFQARILEWVAMPSSRGFSQPRVQTQVSSIAHRFFTIWVTREAHKKQIATGNYQFSQFSLSVVSKSATPCTAVCQASLSITNSQSFLKLMSIESVMPSNHLNLSHPLLLPSIFLSIRVFSNESVLCIRWPKYWSFSFCISPSNEYSGLNSFRMD